MEFEWYEYIYVIVAGIVAGFINTLAGSGSAVTLPLLIFLGLDAGVANGTNRVAIVLQNVVAVASFRKNKALDWRQGFILAAPAVLGGVVGAYISTLLDPEVLKRFIGGVMLLVLATILLKPNRFLKPADDAVVQIKSWHMPLFFLIGMYGGFVQVGAGVFLLFGLVMGAGFDLVKGNAVKVLIIFCFTLTALAVFVWKGQVDWKVGLILSIGNMTGAWLGVKTAMKGSAEFVRWLLIAVISYSSLKLLGILDLLMESIS